MTPCTWGVVSMPPAAGGRAAVSCGVAWQRLALFEGEQRARQRCSPWPWPRALRQHEGGAVTAPHPREHSGPRSSGLAPRLRFPRSFLPLSRGFGRRGSFPLTGRDRARFPSGRFREGRRVPAGGLAPAPRTSGAAWAVSEFSRRDHLGRTRPRAPGRLLLCTLGGAGGPGPAGRGAVSYFRAVAPEPRGMTGRPGQRPCFHISLSRSYRSYA